MLSQISEHSLVVFFRSRINASVKVNRIRFECSSKWCGICPSHYIAILFFRARSILYFMWVCVGSLAFHMHGQQPYLIQLKACGVLRCIGSGCCYFHPYMIVNHSRNNKFDTENDILCALMDQCFFFFISSSPYSPLALTHAEWMLVYFIYLLLFRFSFPPTLLIAFHCFYFRRLQMNRVWLNVFLELQRALRPKNGEHYNCFAVYENNNKYHMKCAHVREWCVWHLFQKKRLFVI